MALRVEGRRKRSRGRRDQRVQLYGFIRFWTAAMIFLNDLFRVLKANKKNNSPGDFLNPCAGWR